ICASVAWQSLLLTSYLSFGFLSLMIVLIDVSLSHPFCLPPPPYCLFAILSVNFLAYAHPLHECSKCRKGVDHFDLYLASGLGMSQDKIPKKTKCETLVNLLLNTKILFLVYPYPLSCTQTPFGDIRVTDNESSCTFMFRSEEHTSELQSRLHL